MVDNKNILLCNLWYYALPSSHLKTGKMVSRVLLREPILFTRDKNGQVFAIEDICPHRAVPLSCGRFDGEQVECRYISKIERGVATEMAGDGGQKRQTGLIIRIKMV